MPPRTRHASTRHEPIPLAPSEGWLVVQTIALVAFSAWAFGGSVEWAVPWILALTAISLLLLIAARRERGTISLLPFLPAILWMAFVVIAILNPSHSPHANGGWIQRAGWIPWLPTTAEPARTLRDVTLWLPPLLQAGVLVAVLRTPRAARFIWAAVALNGFALAAVGAAFKLVGAQQLLGVLEGQEPTYFFATFFYKNHWAAYGALGAAAAFTMAHDAWPRALAGDPRARGRALLFAVAGMFTAMTLPLPGSRAGLLLASAFILGFVTLMLVTWRRETRAPRGRSWPVVVGAMLVAAVLVTGLQAYSSRAATDLDRTRAQLRRSLDGESLDLRIPLSRDTWRMTLGRPWFGWGPGCFEIVFPVYQGNYLRGADGRPAARFEAAHNDWFQLTAENGFLGAALLLVPLACFARRAWRAADISGRCGLAACGVIAAYALIDFPFHNRAVLLLWAVMLSSAPRLRPDPEES